MLLRAREPAGGAGAVWALGRALAAGFVLLALLVGISAPAKANQEAGAGAREGTGAPSLRIEIGAHLAPIRSLVADRSGVHVVTAAEDKTARIWDAATGALLSVFRPPSGPGNDGKLYAVAMLPDASLFATGGWSAGNEVYLVRRNDGRIVHRLPGLPEVVTHLSFSPDGRMLAVGLAGRNGVRVFQAVDAWTGARELAGDAQLAGEVNATAWAPDGKTLVVSSADGYVRAYEATSQGLRRLASAALSGAGVPFGLAFSPDGATIAVGTADQGSIDLFEARTLKLRRVLPPPSERPGRSLSVVAWAADGRHVFAAGSWTDERGRFVACLWPARGDGAARLIPLARNTITALHALADGRLLFAAADPAWGALGADERVAFVSSAGLLDFRHQRSRFRLAPDGSAISLRERSAAGDDAFDLRQLAWGRSGKEWSAPRHAAGRTTVDDWFERQRPLINGKAPTLAANEWSLSASVSRDGNRVALATSQYLRSFDRNGNERWKTPVPATPWQINTSDDGRWLVVGFSDGSLRWYRQEDGSEQLGLFQHADGRRWVAWTAAGNFAASPGGEDLVGWQVGHGPAQAADFYPVSRFRSDYYRPELIGEMFGKSAAPAAPANAGQAIRQRLPPTLRIVSPDALSTQRSSEVKVKLAVRSSAEAPVTRLRARVNGQLVALPQIAALPATRSEQADETVYDVALPLPGIEAQIMLFAENRYGVSPEAMLIVKRPPAEPAAATADSAAAVSSSPAAPGVDLRPALYVLAIGISRYQDPSIQLEFAAKDSTDLANFFKAQEGGLYRKVAVRLLTDAGAKRDDVLDGLEWIRRELTARDVAMVFIAGHGVNDADGTYYFLPQDVNVKHLKRSAVIFTEIRNTLVALPGKAMFFIDTCHSGNVLGTGLRSLRLDTTAVINELSSADNGVIVFAAATGRQYAQESPEWGNGAFTKAILEGLRGKADYNRSGRVTHKMLDLYVSERVKALTEGAQSPVTIVPSGVPDFPLVLGQR